MRISARADVWPRGYACSVRMSVVCAIAVVGGGIAGNLSARPGFSVERHDVGAVRGRAGNPAGRPRQHRRCAGSESSRGGVTPVDTGFIVYNEPATIRISPLLLDHLEVATNPRRHVARASASTTARFEIYSTTFGLAEGLRPEAQRIFSGRQFWAHAARRDALLYRARADRPWTALRALADPQPRRLSGPEGRYGQALPATTICCRWRRRSGRPPGWKHASATTRPRP